MKIKEYINSRPAIKSGIIAKKVGWNVTSMSQYMNGDRDIPEKWEKKIKQELKKYGYNG